MPIHVSASGTGRVAVVTLAGEHDLTSAEELRRTLLDLTSRVPLVVLDLAGTTFLDSSVLGVFVGAAKRAGRHGNQLIGINAHGIALRALELTGLDQLLSLGAPEVDLDAELALLLPPSPGSR